ncbi:MAG TPA: hypothetical protein VK590_02955 [Saprospiraceae bacterium]|nr:hypothetical protein [Saprospiraceae bacterium]
MKRVIFIIILSFPLVFLFAQEKTGVFNRPNNLIYLDFFGDGSLFSINYERQYFLLPYLFFTGKAGLGYNQNFNLCFFGSCNNPKKDYLTLPYHVTANIGGVRNFFEFGIGGTILGGNSTQYFLSYPILGYRYQAVKPNSFNFRVFFSFPFNGTDDYRFLFIPIGISVGRGF